jgi:hypothetical protein
MVRKRPLLLEGAQPVCTALCQEPISQWVPEPGPIEAGQLIPHSTVKAHLKVLKEGVTEQDRQNHPAHANHSQIPQPQCN